MLSLQRDEASGTEIGTSQGGVWPFTLVKTPPRIRLDRVPQRTRNSPHLMGEAYTKPQIESKTCQRCFGLLRSDKIGAKTVCHGSRWHIYVAQWFTLTEIP